MQRPRLWFFALVLTLVAFGGRPALAQTCLGYAPVTSVRSSNIGGSIQFNDNATAFSFIAIGGNDSAFGGASVGWNSLENTDVTSISISGFGGGQVAAGTNRRIVICPGGEASYEYGPNNLGNSGIDLSALSIFGGVTVGFVAVDSPTVQITPAVGFLVGGTTVWAKAGDVSESAHDTYGIIRAAVGLVLNSSTTIAPTLSVPVGLPGDTDPTFGITFLWSF